MRHLLALLEGGTHGTRAEPARMSRRPSEESAVEQWLTVPGTLGTRGTFDFEQVGAHDSVALRVRELVDAWHERMAICLEAGDISEAEAEITAALEVGRAFVRIFIHDQPGRQP